MNSFDALVSMEWKALILLGIGAFSILFALLAPLWRNRLSKDSPYRGARGLDDINARSIYSLGASRVETPYLPHITLRATLGVRLGVAGLVGAMVWYIMQPPAPGVIPLTGSVESLVPWVILGFAVYQLIWIGRFYVKYDSTTLESISWLHRRKSFEQNKLVSVRAQPNSQTYRLQYEKGHVDVLMYVQDRDKFLRDMRVKIAENDVRLL